MVREYASFGWTLGSMSKHKFGLALGRVTLSLVGFVKPLLPRRVLKTMDDRFFGAVFHVTRVTNDNYDSSTKERPANLDENG